MDAKGNHAVKSQPPHDHAGAIENGTFQTPNEMFLREVITKMQADGEKVENTYKYNKFNIGEHKERLVQYNKVLNSEESGQVAQSVDDEIEQEQKGHKYRMLVKARQQHKKQQDKEDLSYHEAVNCSKQMTDFLESKVDMLSTFRKRKFAEYHTQRLREPKPKKDPKLNPIYEAKKLNEVLNKNSLKIEKSLLSLFNLDEESDSDIDENVNKKSKNNKEQPLHLKQVGYKISDFLKIPKYKLNPMKLPIFTNLFDDATEFAPVFVTKTEEKSKHAKPKRGDAVGGAAISSKDDQKNIAKPEIPTFYDDMKKKALTEQEKEEAKEKFLALSPAERAKFEEKQLKKQWQSVVRESIRIYRFTQKFKMDVEQNYKKFAILCAKEVKKKIQRNQRAGREYIFRAKRMHREMVTFWRKREKELNDLKKRKEKLEYEIRKREEEERESLLQRKRLEFLMKQSDIYAHFMAKKLGGNEGNKDDPNQPKEKSAIEGADQQMAVPSSYKKVDIDEEAAYQSIQGLINSQRLDLVKFDQETKKERMELGGPEGETANFGECDLDELKKAQSEEGKEGFDLSAVNISGTARVVNQPKCFKGDLKQYQLKGLRWLDNLYEQGINGILADEMGLGKTIQAIALMAHISEAKGNWGPFLVVAYATTLYNWQQEIQRFCPDLKVLPYWGGRKERNTIRKYFQPKLWGTPQSQFHVVVTSYQMICQDEKVFHRLKWQHMILDEAQAIKNTESQRWKILLGIFSRNKLLLTGTPIQNTMAELWALLHFIMPKLFDSHDQFQEWFSKDIEAHSQDQKELNQHQLQRLHAILKPFMLRRVKKDVENEIPQKKEIQILCEMTQRQRELYNLIKRNISIKDFFKMLESNKNKDNLMNLVMQFRKVCNHPELFERRQLQTPFVLRNFGNYSGHLLVPFGQIKSVGPDCLNPIEYYIPKPVYDDFISNHNGKDFVDRFQLIRKYFCIYDSGYVHERLFEGKAKTVTHHNNPFSFLRFTGLTENMLELSAKYDNLYTVLILMHYLKTLSHKSWINEGQLNDDESKHQRTKNMFWIDRKLTNLFNLDMPIFNKLIKTKDQVNQSNYGSPLKFLNCVYERATSGPVVPQCNSLTFVNRMRHEAKPQVLYSIFYGHEFAQAKSQNSNSENIPKMCLSWIPIARRYIHRPVIYTPLIDKKVSHAEIADNLPNVQIPDFDSLVADSCKLKYLNMLLPKLKREGHRVLIFCQMTKMMDILEEYLNKQKYLYFRLDGSSNVADRRDMVLEFQQNPDYFAFLLSTRAGGLGVTLTAADVVIFYDSDWNPTMDAQATDRAHRIGQTKDVYVYRVITKGTIEEKIVRRAQQKQNVQATVYSGGAFKAEFKPQDYIEMLFDENELSDNETKKFMAKSGTGPGRKKGPSKKDSKKDTAQKNTRGAKKKESEAMADENEEEGDSEIASKKMDTNSEIDMLNEDENE